MAENESIGAVSVTLTGDLGPLAATLKAAQAQAAAAGGEVASAFSTGAASVEEMASASVAAASAQAGFTTATEGATAALGHQVTQIQAVGGAVRVLSGEQGIRVVERFLTSLGAGTIAQAAYPLLGLVATTEIAIRAFQHFAAVSEEAKAAQKELADQQRQTDAAFDESARVIYRAAEAAQTRQFGAVAGTKEHIKGLEDEIAALNNKIKETAGDSVQLATQAEHVMRTSLRTPQSVTEEYAPKIQANADKIAAYQQKIQDLNVEISSSKGLLGFQSAAQSGALSAAGAQGRIAAIERETSATKLSIESRIDLEHMARQHAIADIDDEAQHRIAEAQEAIRVAHDRETQITAAIQAELPKRIAAIQAEAAAQGAGKSAEEQAKINAEAANRVAEAKGQAQAAIAALHQETLKATEAFVAAGDEVARQLRAGESSFTEAMNRMLLQRAETARKAPADLVASGYNEAALTRADEILAKGAGQQQAMALQRQKIALEQEYATTVFKTRATEVAYEQQIAQLTEQEYQLRIQGLAKDLADAEAVAASVKGTEAYVAALEKVANLKNQIAGASQQEQTATAQAAASAALQSPQAQLQQQFGQMFQSLPGQVGNDLGSAVAEGLLGHHPGKSIGKEMADSLEQGLKATLGNILKQGISSLFQFGLSFLGFAEGTDSAPGGPALVGEKGPEIVNLPRGSQVIPNHAIRRYADGTPGWRSSFHSTAFQSATTVINFHAHGIHDPHALTDQVMRIMPDRLKARYPGFSPLSSS